MHSLVSLFVNNLWSSCQLRNHRVWRCHEPQRQAPDPQVPCSGYTCYLGGVRRIFQQFLMSFIYSRNSSKVALCFFSLYLLADRGTTQRGITSCIYVYHIHTHIHPPSIRTTAKAPSALQG